MDKQLIDSLTSGPPLTPRETALYNLLERALGENESLKSIIQELRDEIARLKGGPSKPAFNKKKPVDYSSKEAKPKKDPSTKHEKKEKKEIPFDRKILVEIPEDQLPEDAVKNGSRQLIIQEIRLERDNLLFTLQNYVSPSTGQYYSASLPEEYQGYELGPHLRGLLLLLHYGCRMTHGLIRNFLHGFDIDISEGTLSNCLTKKHDGFHDELDEAFKVSLVHSDFVQMDDTGAKHKCKNGYTLAICSAYMTRFFTSYSKSRLQVLRSLMGGNDLHFQFVDVTLLLTEGCQAPQWVMQVLQTLEGKTFDDAESLKAAIQESSGELPGKQCMENILFYSALTYYMGQEEYFTPRVIVCDDAGQFKLIAAIEALCWVHLGRNFRKLQPKLPFHITVLASFLDDFWKLYHELLDYQKNPGVERKKELAEQFDQLFHRKTGWEELDLMIEATFQKKRNYLVTLDKPQVPLHNNHTEQQIRERVVVRRIRHGTRSEDGLKAADTFYSLKATCDKLEISFWEYLKNRVMKSGNIPRISELIRAKVEHHTSFA